MEGQRKSATLGLRHMRAGDGEMEGGELASPLDWCPLFFCATNGPLHMYLLLVLEPSVVTADGQAAANTIYYPTPPIYYRQSWLAPHHRRTAAGIIRQHHGQRTLPGPAYHI